VPNDEEISPRNQEKVFTVCQHKPGHDCVMVAVLEVVLNVRGLEFPKKGLN